MPDRKARSKGTPVRKMTEMKQFVSNRAAIATEPASIIKWSGTLDKHCRYNRREKRHVQITDKSVIYWKKKGEKNIIPFTWQKDVNTRESNSPRVDCDNKKRNITIYSSERKFEFTAEKKEDFKNIKTALGFGHSNMTISEPWNLKHHFAVHEDRNTKQLSILGADKSVENNDDVIAEFKRRGNEKVPAGLDITDQYEKNGVLHQSFLFNQSQNLTLSKKEFDKIKPENFDTISIRSDLLFGDNEEQGLDLNPIVTKEKEQTTDLDFQQLGSIDEIEKPDEDNKNRSPVESTNLTLLIPESTRHKEGISDASCVNKDAKVCVDDIDSTLHQPSLDQIPRDLMSKIPTSCTNRRNISACPDRSEVEQYVTTDGQIETNCSLKLDPKLHICQVDPKRHISEPPIPSTTIMSVPLDRKKGDGSSGTYVQRNTLHSLKENSSNMDSNMDTGTQISKHTISSTKLSYDPDKKEDRKVATSDINVQEKINHFLKETVLGQALSVDSAAVEICPSRLPDQDTKCYSKTVGNNISELPKPVPGESRPSADNGKGKKNEGSHSSTSQTSQTFKENLSDRESVTSSTVVEIEGLGPPNQESVTSSTAVEIEGLGPPNQGSVTSSTAVEIEGLGPPNKESVTSSTAVKVEGLGPPNQGSVTSSTAVEIERSGPPNKESVTSSTAVEVEGLGPPNQGSVTSSTAVEVERLGPPNKESVTSSTAVEVERLGPPNQGSVTSSTAVEIEPSGPPNKESVTSSTAVEIGRSGPSDHESMTGLAALKIERAGLPDQNSKLHSMAVEENRRTHRNIDGYYSSSDQNTLVADEICQSDPEDQKCDICSGVVANRISDCPIHKIYGRHIPTSPGMEQDEANENSLNYHLQPKISSTFKEHPPDLNVMKSSDAADKQQRGAPGFHLSANSGTFGSNKAEPTILVPGKSHISTSLDNGREKKYEGSQNCTSHISPTFKKNLPDQESVISSGAVEMGRSGLVDRESVTTSTAVEIERSGPPDQESMTSLGSAERERFGPQDHLQTGWDDRKVKKNEGSHCSTSRNSPAFKESPTDKEHMTSSGAVEKRRSGLPDCASVASSTAVEIKRSEPQDQESVTNLAAAEKEQFGQQDRNPVTSSAAVEIGRSGPPDRVSATRATAVEIENKYLDANDRFRSGNTIRREFVPLQTRPNRGDIEVNDPVHHRNQRRRTAAAQHKVNDPVHQQNQRRRTAAAQHRPNNRIRIGNTVRLRLCPLQPRQNRIDAGQAARVLPPRHNFEAAGREVRVLQPRQNLLPAERVLRVFAARPNMVNAGANHVRIGSTINVDQNNQQLNQNQNVGSIGEIQGHVDECAEDSL